MDTKSFNSFYEAFKSKDKRLDGKYFMGVSSTGIYCRPVCTAKMPKKENCTFYKSAAEAELNGYRPCLTCRPELAPGNAKVDSSKTILKKALKLIDDGLLEENNLQELSLKLGVSDRHLRRIFKDELNISPIDYIETSRLLLAKNLLTDTKLSILDVAFASGFKSLRRFNASFRDKYKMPPSHFRKENNSVKTDTITLKLGYKEPFRYEALLKFLEHRIIPKVEKVENNKYYKTIAIKKGNIYVYGYIIVANNKDKSALEITLSESLVKVLPQVLSVIRNIFDLNSDPYAVYDVLKGANNIIPNCFKIGTRIPGSPNDFEMVVRAIIGQLISVEKATEVLSSFCKKYGKKLETNIDGLEYVFPIPESISSLNNIYDELCSLKMTRIKADAIKGMAEILTNEKLSFKGIIDSKETMNKMLKVKGIGKWTVDYVAMRGINETDILLDTDYAIKKIMKIKNIEDVNIFDKYKPYRTYLTIGLWEIEKEILENE
ncbi:DNA-3-methyladenine glycosylase 2 family protein [uncultured Dubosiella sp.]|uniref:DNA-3-methyladenine glycosylase 2 family protein n=3 Tax=uncultured Dubosiella sp. TaxID=1937011 RepID=UPI0025996749|nr:Ada metal-binding domain-containing protein [uncultured Dubosiella sp.]